MGKKAQTESSDDSADTVAKLATCNGSQLALYPWMRELDGNTVCFESDVAYFLTNNSSWVNNAGKAVFSCLPHPLMLCWPEQGSSQPRSSTRPYSTWITKAP